MQATCDSCKGVFDVKYREKQHPKGIKETYFKCKHCGRKYFCFATDQATRKLQKEKKQLELKLRSKPEDAAAIIQQADALQVEVNKRMAALKAQLI